MVWCSQCLRRAWEGWAASSGLSESIVVVCRWRSVGMNLEANAQLCKPTHANNNPRHAYGQGFEAGRCKVPAQQGRQLRKATNPLLTPCFLPGQNCF